MLVKVLSSLSEGMQRGQASAGLLQLSLGEPPRTRLLSTHLATQMQVLHGGPTQMLQLSLTPESRAPNFLTLTQVQGHELHGGPQMLQLSLDGKRLYVTNSLFGPWDRQFYPDMVAKGSYLLQVWL